MKKINKLLFLFLLILVGVACDEENDVPDLPEVPDSPVVINELLPINNNVVADQNGEFEDWVELYNLTDEDVDLSGYYLTDSKKNPTKWQFPEGTSILAKDFLIIWTDGDSLQAGLHTNYRLSSDGEKVLLLDSDLNILDETEYPSTVLQESWSRIPNGTGDFQYTTPTFNAPND